MLETHEPLTSGLADFFRKFISDGTILGIFSDFFENFFGGPDNDRAVPGDTALARRDRGDDDERVRRIVRHCNDLTQVRQVR
jgi:hypothetical protein